MWDVIPAGPSPASLLVHLRELIAANGGFLSFERFMREALYHPQFGYYTRQIPTVGRTGDFATSVTLHVALGKAVAAWAVSKRSALPEKGGWHLVELGGGGGQLALNILESLGWWQRRQLRYHIVERSLPLRLEQQKRLARWPQVCWHEEIEAALAKAEGRAIIISNEFVDAFPCMVLSWEGAGCWHEVGIQWDENRDRLVETSRPLKPPDDIAYNHSSIFDPPFIRGFTTGQRVEWHREYHRWLLGWKSLWTSGAMLTVDYGSVLPALYHRRPQGTLRGYFRHQHCTGAEIYSRPGNQDLTADVNFTDLMRWGTALGWECTLCDQANFLDRWLPEKFVRKICDDPAFRFLTDPDGAGGAFQTLEQFPR